MFWTRPIHIFLLELLSDEFYIEFKINTLFKPTVLVLLCVVMTTNDPHSLSVLGHCCCFCNSRVHGTVCSTNQKWNGIGGTVVIQYKTLQRHRSLTLWQLLRCVWWRTTQLGLCAKLPWLWAHDKAMALSRFGEASVKMIIHESGIRDPPSIPPCSEAIFIQRITKTVQHNWHHADS